MSEVLCQRERVGWALAHADSSDGNRQHGLKPIQRVTPAQSPALSAAERAEVQEPCERVWLPACAGMTRSGVSFDWM